MPTRDEVIKFLRDLSVEEVKTVLQDIEDAWLSRIILHQPCQGCLKVVFGPHACPGPDRSGQLLAAAYGTAPTMGGTRNPPAPEDQWEFDVVLVGYPPEKKIQIIKKIRELTLNTSLTDAVKLATTLPSTLASGFGRGYSEHIAGKLRAVGAVVEIR